MAVQLYLRAPTPAQCPCFLSHNFLTHFFTITEKSQCQSLFSNLKILYSLHSSNLLQVSPVTNKTSVSSGGCAACSIIYKCSPILFIA